MKRTKVLMAAVITTGLMGCGPGEEQQQADETSEAQTALRCVVGHIECPSSGETWDYSYTLGCAEYSSRSAAEAACNDSCPEPCFHGGFY